MFGSKMVKGSNRNRNFAKRRASKTKKSGNSKGDKLANCEREIKK